MVAECYKLIIIFFSCDVKISKPFMFGFKVKKIEAFIIILPDIHDLLKEQIEICMMKKILFRN